MSLLWLVLHFARATTSTFSSPAHTIQLVPDQLALAGDVATVTNTVGHCTEVWLSNVPAGTIILGVDPALCDPVDWDGGSATGEVFLQDVYSPTVYTLRLSWPDRDGKGLHSPERDRMGTIALDGQSLWGKRTTHQSTFGDYYGAEHEPILTTIVITQSVTHTLSFSVPARTAWDLSLIELVAYPYPTAVRGIGYSPFRDCQYPGGTLQPSVQDLREDLFRLFHTSNAIRTYAAGGINGQVPALANEIGLPVYAGAWIDYPQETTLEEDDAEIQALIDLACTADLEGVIVGNEYYLRSGRTADDIDYLRQRIQEVRNGIQSRCGKDVPITTAEIDNLMFEWESESSSVIQGIASDYRSILDKVDFVMMHTYPFWNQMPIDGAAAFTVDRYQAIQALIEREYPGQGKWIVIGEAGWPSGGAANDAAVPSPENQRRYMLEFLYLAKQAGVNLMYFDAFDELWKIEEPGRVGQHWGYSYTDRAAKHSFYGVLVPSEQLFPYRVYLPYVFKGSTAGTPYRAGDLLSPLSWPTDIQASDAVSFPVYTEWPMDPGNFVPSGWIGDFGNIDLYECERTNPHSGEMAIRVSFSPTGTVGWSGIYWQHPAGNWGGLPGGLDLSASSRLTFAVRGEQGGELVEFLVGGLGEPTDPYSDTIQPARSTGPIVLSDTWQEIEISLEGADLSRVIGGFAWVASRCYNSEPITFYIDDMVFDFDPAPEPLPPPTPGPFYVYDDDNSGCTHFVPSGWQGDIDDISLDQAWAGAPYRGTTAISITYSALGSNGEGWAGVYWQDPENNWGDDPDGGFDLSWANKLTFQAKGEQGGEKVRFFVGGMGTKDNAYPDSLRPEASTGFIQLEDTWRVYTVNLWEQDLTHVIGGFGLATDQCANPAGATFYLDDIAFEYDPDLPPLPPSPPPSGSVFPVYTDAAAQDNHYSPTGWMGDGEVPGRLSLTECWYDNPHNGQTAIRVAYADEMIGWAGVYWVHPAENWGDRPGGYDLTGADRLTFWARSDTPGAAVKFLIGGIGYPDGTVCWNPSEPYPDSVCPKIEETRTLYSTWTEYTIDLPQSRDLGNVVGGFGWVAENKVTFYLDDITYEFDQVTHR